MAVSFNERTGLALEFLENGKVIAARTYGMSNGIILSADGTIELPKAADFVGGEGVVGYQSRTTRLFINTNGELVSLQSGGGGGTAALVIPVGIYVETHGDLCKETMTTASLC